MQPVQRAVQALVVLLVAAVASCFPSGAPLSACGHLMPIHEEAEAQETAPPFFILLSHTNYTSGEPIAGKSQTTTPFVILLFKTCFMFGRSITVSVTSRDPYLAFMLQGRTRDNQPVGHFSYAPAVAKFLSCYGDNDTLSHAAAFERTTMQVLWHPPKADVGDVFITGSIASTKYIFWAVESELIKGKPRESGADRQTSCVLVIALSLVTIVVTRLFHSSHL
ncbi:putative defense protein 3 [Babylonia areolata]|uniref:putative defense protein 3 n=1 Tax=Babylonia areolata TaxID=304850 RepID=UPI003FD2824E